jgi:hypothetical protein
MLFVSGPELSFIIDSLTQAEDIIKAMGYDRDEYTITDIDGLGICLCKGCGCSSFNPQDL